nr:CHASE4 domain-containing protein [uncultured Dongia sp.]
MKIQARILIMLATVSLLALAVLVGVLLTVVAPAFEQLDQEQATKNINRVKQSLANELAVLDQKVVDWAHWNDTYAFVLDASPDYIAANLQSSSLTNLNVSFMAFFDPGGKPVWAGGYDAANEEAKDFAALADPAQTRALTTGRQRSVHGLLVMDGRNYLISAGDILDSDGNGPSHGTLAIGREIDEALLGDLKSRTEVNFRTEPHELGRSNAAPDGPILVAETAELLTHRITLRDVNDIPLLDIYIETPRDAGLLGHASIGIAITLMISTILLIMIALALAINMLIIRPVHQINLAMGDVANSADLEKRLGWHRGDEFGTLARQFDHMLEQLAHARRDLLELTFKIGRSDLATGMFHNVRNAMSPLANQVHRAVATLTGAEDGHAERAFAELKDESTEPARKTRLIDFLAAAWSQATARQQSIRRELEAATGQLAAIEQILNQQEGPNVAASTESLPLAFLIRESLNFFGTSQLATANIEIEPSVEAMPPVAVQRLPMIHVIYNVIANAVSAIEARDDGAGRVLMRAGLTPENGMVRLEIVDNGIGAAIHSLTDIFRPGYTTKKDQKGGEGLHWCANTMAACGGRMWAESAGPGKGMTIFIEIPQATAQQPTPTTPRHAA